MPAFLFMPYIGLRLEVVGLRSIGNLNVRVGLDELVVERVCLPIRSCKQQLASKSKGMRNMKTTWITERDEGQIKFGEVPCTTDDQPVSYSEAKTKSLDTLQGEIDVLISLRRRIEMDESKWAYPDTKAWINYTEDRLVIAKTKKRARELVGETRYCLDNDWSPVAGHWWYPYGAEESEWGRTTSNDEVWLRPLPKEEAEKLANEELERFRAMGGATVAVKAVNPVFPRFAGLGRLDRAWKPSRL
jgi:hypothetical protein